MAATKTTDRDLNVQVLEDTVRGMFAGRDALIGSVLVSSGALIVSSSMPGGGPEWIGNELTVPYFGVIGEFVDNPEDTAITPKVIKSMTEKSSVARSSLAFEVTRQARHSNLNDDDPYNECGEQIKAAAVRRMDELAVTQMAGTPLVKDVYSTTTPVFLDWDLVTDARALYGDEGESIVGMVMHSQVEAGLRKLKDANGRPLMLDALSSQQPGLKITTFMGVPVHVSDRVPLTGSVMSPLAMTEAGTTPPDFTISGTPTGPWRLRIKITLGGARGTFKFQFSTDGGNTYSADLTSAASVPLIDPATDSLVGNNGNTGLTVAIENASANVDNTYSSNALLKATTLIAQPRSAAFWYSAANMGLETDKDILKHNDVAAMHMYHLTHRYRRRRGGTKPGVVKIVHNIPGFAG